MRDNSRRSRHVHAHVHARVAVGNVAILCLQADATELEMHYHDALLKYGCMLPVWSCLIHSRYMENVMLADLIEMVEGELKVLQIATSAL